MKKSHQQQEMKEGKKEIANREIKENFHFSVTNSNNKKSTTDPQEISINKPTGAC
jgi:hypothetical protein